MHEEDRLARNRAVWFEVNAQFTDSDADTMWSVSDISWGLFRIPEAELGLVGAVAEQRVVELGCGTAYLSAWLARAGAQVVAVDLSHHQLQTARRCQRDVRSVVPSCRRERGSGSVAERRVRSCRERVRRKPVV